ncbi:MAG: efflux RND transporter periplasmic adaptor subunit [Phycisphaerales bacterium]|nr:efflux RND transporter periplasmic adaptor subunit [Phycisphaerales bacterium]
MIDVSKIRAPGWARVVTELAAEAPDDRAFFARLLAVLGQVAGARQAALMLVPLQDDGDARVTLVWPPQERPPEEAIESLPDVKAAARAAATSRSMRCYDLKATDGLYDGGREGYVVAAPIPQPEGAPACNCIVLLTERRSQQAMQTTLALVEVLVGYIHGHGARQQLRRLKQASAALDLGARLIASVNQASNFKGASIQLCNDLCRQLTVDRVALGWTRGVGRSSAEVRVIAMSDTEHIDRRMAMVRKVEAAMDECLDQEQAVLHPVPESRQDVQLAQAITHAHKDLASADAKLKVASLPLRVDDDVVGVLTIETTGEGTLDIGTIELLQAAMDLVTPVLRVRRNDDRALPLRAKDSMVKGAAWVVGPKHTVWKLVGLALLAVAVTVTFVRVPYRIEAPVEIQPVTKRVVSCPHTGILRELPLAIEPGATVQEGDLLAQLDTIEDQLSLNDAVAQYQEASTKHDEAMNRGRTSEASQYLAQMEQASARIGLFQERIDRSSIRAPIDGVIIAGDMRQMVGATIETGQALFEVAPLDRMQLKAKVEDRDIQLLIDRQAEAGEITGDIATRARPWETFPFRVDTIVPLAQPEEGTNTFEVRATMTTEPARWMRPGMEGLAKFNTGDRSLIDIGTKRVRDTLKLWLWW